MDMGQQGDDYYELYGVGDVTIKVRIKNGTPSYWVNLTLSTNEPILTDVGTLKALYDTLKVLHADGLM